MNLYGAKKEKEDLFEAEKEEHSKILFGAKELLPVFESKQTHGQLRFGQVPEKLAGKFFQRVVV